MINQQAVLSLPECVYIIPDTTKRQARYAANPNYCLVCGDRARIINYGALSCASCKTFFRRHGFRIEEVNPCRFNGNCVMTVRTRKVCSACRLARCLSIGMSRDLIRKEDLSDGKLVSKLKLRNNRHTMSCTTMLRSAVHPLDLLNTDRSGLSTSDWALLSNVIHAYDIISPVASIHSEMLRQSKLPMKIRTKLAQELIPNLLVSFRTSLQSYVKCSNEFQMFNIDEQYSISERNFHTTSSLIGQLILRESGIFKDSTYLNAFATLYDIQTLTRAASIMQRLDYDSMLVKIFLVVISFSSNCFKVENKIDFQYDCVLGKTKQLFFYQNLYTVVLWKYMTFRYGHREAAVRFAGLIKQVMDLLSLVIDSFMENTTLKTLSSKVTKNSTCLLYFRSEHKIE